ADSSSRKRRVPNPADEKTRRAGMQGRWGGGRGFQGSGEGIFPPARRLAGTGIGSAPMAPVPAGPHDGRIAFPEHAMAFAIRRPVHLLSAALLLACGSANAAVFINEVHYDNAGSDSGEGVEVV